MINIVLSATGTGIGKTIASAILLAHVQKTYKSICYHKMIQTGAPEDNDSLTVANLLHNPDIACTVGMSFKKPLSPHVAAHDENAYIEVSSVLSAARKSCIGDVNLVEGIGGLLVPINNRHLLIDIIKKLQWPCVIVADSRLGTINHTLLSLEALRTRKITLFGVIMTGPKNRHNEHAIHYFGRVKNLLWLPHLSTLNHECLMNLVMKRAEDIDDFLHKGSLCMKA